jgi:hypothetical protein
VFMRATPRVVTGQTAPTGADGIVTLTLVPNQLFLQPRDGFNVQFFIKASKPGDPGLGGVAGYRPVQVTGGLSRNLESMRSGGGVAATPISSDKGVEELASLAGS